MFLLCYSYYCCAHRCK